MDLSTIVSVIAGLVAIAVLYWGFFAPIPEGMWEAKTREARSNIALAVFMALFMVVLTLHVWLF